MAFPIKTCVLCGEEFELRPNKPGYANRCPSAAHPRPKRGSHLRRARPTAFRARHSPKQRRAPQGHARHVNKGQLSCRRVLWFNSPHTLQRICPPIPRQGSSCSWKASPSSVTDNSKEDATGPQVSSSEFEFKDIGEHHRDHGAMRSSEVALFVELARVFHVRSASRVSPGRLRLNCSSTASWKVGQYPGSTPRPHQIPESCEGPRPPSPDRFLFRALTLNQIGLPMNLKAARISFARNRS